ncbi:MAG: GIY-YIG nuclease family protein [Hyphomicrobiaceae bacterium]|nr:GIY-YIG nuclease family protein [Hyphomicrobiaceae bacterium]
MQTFFVTMLASKPYGTLYIGVTNDIIRRIKQHCTGEGWSFTRRYKVHTLVRYEPCTDIREAIQREKTMKEWPRVWKTNLIEHDNPHWMDLYPSLTGVRPVGPI